MNVSSSAVPPTKRPSRSNSISSSIVTIKKSASVSSRNGPRTSYLRNRSASPDPISRVLHSLNNSRSDFRGRTDALENRKTGGSLHVNRWSHSTSSSLSAIDTDLIRKRTSSIRRSVGTSYGSNHAAPTPQARSSQDYKLESRGSPKRSSSSSNRASPLPGSRLAFQDSSNFRIVQDSSQAQSLVHPNISVPTWEQSSGVNKFGEPVQSLSIQYTTATNQSIQPSSIRALNYDSSAQSNQSQRAAHGRNTEQSQAKSQDISNNHSTSSESDNHRTEPSNIAETRSPKRRDMLSRALAKANEAVLLDNAQNINAAIEAYNDACELLQQVMVRSADLADRRKLSSIKATYSRRIAELHDFDNTFVDLMRPLPEDPPIDDYENPEDFYQEEPSYQTTAINDAPAIQLPLRQESLLPEIFGGDNYIHDRALPPVPQPIPNSRLNVPMDEQYMPQPLSPRPLILQHSDEQTTTPTQPSPNQQVSQAPHTSDHTSQSTWLEISDTQSSKASSRLSSLDYDRQDGQLMSAIEAEFDAMNAAVDSAYDDVLDQETTPRHMDRGADVGNATRYDHLAGRYLDKDAEEEERLLDGITNDFDVNEAQFGQQSLSALPRKSDSSSFSGRTWDSSFASTTATTRTTLSTLAETIEPSPHAPPTTALPEPPMSPPKISETEKPLPAVRPVSSDKHIGIRDRRMSGQSAKQLKIETFVRRSSITQQAKPPQPVENTPPVEQASEAPKEIPLRTLAPAASFSSSFSSTLPLTPMLSVHSGEMPLEESPATPALTQGGSTDDGIFMDPSPSRHGRMLPPPPGPIVRKNLSSSNLGKGSLSINTVQLDVDSPITPGSAMFPSDARKPQSGASSAVSSAGGHVVTSIGLGGMYLFEDHIGDSRGIQSPNQITQEPAPLEPCPDAFLLRPFWLMRCLYQALSHPRGGYISTRLFVPRDIWRVRGIKIKGIDDKVAQCDLLTAALQNLAKVNTLDADAVMDEMHAFENILEQVRMALSKKLGSDVGISGSSSVFKSSPATEDSHDLLSSKSNNASSAAKSFASSWRKLRSKSSSANLGPSIRNENKHPSVTMASLPMTSSSSVATSRSYLNTRNRYPPPTPSELPQLLAPNAIYISSLARLFDAAQVLDGIARQVEDPGLKSSSQTYVGIELSVRNAAEFFSFYIIRFVVSDVLMLLDKFIKRGGEWVLS